MRPVHGQGGLAHPAVPDMAEMTTAARPGLGRPRAAARARLASSPRRARQRPARRAAAARVPVRPREAGGAWPPALGASSAGSCRRMAVSRARSALARVDAPAPRRACAATGGKRPAHRPAGRCGTAPASAAPGPAHPAGDRPPAVPGRAAARHVPGRQPGLEPGPLDLRAAAVRDARPAPPARASQPGPPAAARATGPARPAAAARRRPDQPIAGPAARAARRACTSVPSPPSSRA